LDINYSVGFLTKLTFLAMQVPFKKITLRKALQGTAAVAKQQICLN